MDNFSRLIKISHHKGKDVLFVGDPHILYLSGFNQITIYLSAICNANEISTAKLGSVVRKVNSAIYRIMFFQTF